METSSRSHPTQRACQARSCCAPPRRRLALDVDFPALAAHKAPMCRAQIPSATRYSVFSVVNGLNAPSKIPLVFRWNTSRNTCPPLNVQLDIRNSPYGSISVPCSLNQDHKVHKASAVKTRPATGKASSASTSPREAAIPAVIRLNRKNAWVKQIARRARAVRGCLSTSRKSAHIMGCTVFSPRSGISGPPTV